MRETQENIKNYQEQLVKVKSKIAAVGLFFLMSIAMLTTASFAWVVLSTAPEVKGITTTIAGNGNLEIALAHSDKDGNLLSPESSTVGDGTKDLVDKNITWGNLVNLSHSSYGLHKMVLRPAALYPSNLLETPLVAVKYSNDGRVQYVDNQGLVYSNYDSTANSNQGSFIVERIRDYGVRAVSSVKLENLNGTAITEKVNSIRNNELAAVKRNYQSVLDMQVTSSDGTKIAAIDEIVKVMAKYMNTVLNGATTENFKENLGNIITLMKEFNNVLVDTLDVYAVIINEQASIAGLNEVYTGESILQYGASHFTSKKLAGLDGMADIIKMYNDVQTHIKTLEAKNVDSVTTVYWSEISTSVNYLVQINTCYLGNDTTKNLSFYAGNKMQAIQLVGKEVDVTILKGALVDFEKITGSSMVVQNKTITVHYMTDVSLTAKNVRTVSGAPYKMDTNLTNLETALNGGAELTKIAADIYGMVIDFFLRTNAEKTQLTLEGKPVTEEQILTTTVNGVEYDCYVDLNGTIYYFKPNTGNRYTGERDLNAGISDAEKEFLLNGTFIGYSTGIEYSYSKEQQELFISESIQNWAKKTVVVGYDGENRVWEESENLIDGGTRATQGQGSCYIFYPSSVLEQDQMLNVLKGLTVVFIDETGNILARGTLNTEMAYKSTGKVIVPLELDSSSSTVNVDGKDVKYITELTQGQEKFISAIIFLDGDVVSNDLVSESTGVAGYLNLQFGSTETLNPVYDEELANKVINVTAGLGENNADRITLDFKNTTTPSTDVNVVLDGITGSDVHVNFIRQINSSQGVVMDDVKLSGSGTSWKGKAIFTTPGEYILRSVWVDGVEYRFNNDLELRVTVEGLSINNVWLTSNENNIYHISTDNSYSLNVYTSLGANDAIKPTKINALFRNTSGGYTITNLTDDGTGVWSGTATFTKSGTYVLETLSIDGMEYGIPSTMTKTVTVDLGINAKVKLGMKEATFEGKPVAVSVSIDILDNSGKAITDLTNVYLMYKAEGSNLYPGYAELEWDSTSKKYVGNIQFAMAGVYKFYSLGINKTVVDVGENDNILEKTFTNTISKADADTFRFISMDPPKFISYDVDSYQFAPNGDAEILVSIENSMSATGAAEVVHVTEKDGNKVETKYVIYNKTSDSTDVSKLTSGTTTTWKFRLPSLEGTGQTGEWRLNAVYLADVYVQEEGEDTGDMYTLKEGKTFEDSDAGYYTMDLSDKNIETYAVNDLVINLSNDKVTDFAGGVFTSSLGGDYKRSNFKLTIKDQLGNDLQNDSIQIDTTTMWYDYVKDLSSGWQDTNDLAGTKYASGLTLNLQKDANSTGTYISSDSITFLYPGTYNSRLELQVTDIDDSANKVSYAYSVKYDEFTSKVTVSMSNSTSVNCLTVNSTVKNEKVQWTAVNLYLKDTIAQTSTGNTQKLVASDAVSSDKKSVSLGFNHEKTTSCGIDTHTYYYDGLEFEITNVGTFTNVTIPVNEHDIDGSFDDIKFTNPNLNPQTYEFDSIGQDKVTANSYVSLDQMKITNNYGTFTFSFGQITIYLKK